ncbi:unnamed protein product [Caenorhabditis bovis]|uniref:Mitochondrial 2-oxodicarboxylate carrier n=1 Tax=Caenorhabditis bovis TaxID=2654633 RepID=A0A8S1E219_9PELO|nr:unnamed protein product [Caenorhabditis bovis]
MTDDLIKEGIRQIIAGGSAGLIEVCTLHPLDLVKTRLQLPNNKGMMHCIASTYKHEGVLGFYKGIIPPILASTPKTAIRFLTYEQYKKVLCDPDVHPTLGLSMAGLLSGMTEAVIVCPLDVVKVNLQADHSAKGKNTIEMAKSIYNENGFGRNGLYRAVWTTMLRNGLFNMFYFGIYDGFQPNLPDPKDHPTAIFFSKVLLGFVAGAIGSCSNIHLDVAKTRIQGPQPDPKIRKYYGMTQTIRVVYNEEGARALCRGLLPKIMRLGPGGAIMIIAYEHIDGFLKRSFN